MDLSEILGYPVDEKSYELDGDWVLPRQNIGLEFEVEGVTRNRLGIFRQQNNAKLWIDDEDGSLREHGREFKSNGPLFGKDLSDSIEMFIGAATKLDFKATDRCGLHVHLDINNLELGTQFPMLCCLYALFEKPLFKYAGWHRTENNNCVPWFVADDHLELVQGLFRDVTSQKFKQIIHDIQRYSALNLNSLTERPTLEFRHMEMTFDSAQIRGWINLIMALKKGAIALSKRLDYKQLITYLSINGADTLGLEVFGDSFNLIKTPEFSNLVWENLLLLEDLLVLYKTKPTWELKPIYKKDANSLAHLYLKKHPQQKKEKE